MLIGVVGVAAFVYLRPVGATTLSDTDTFVLADFSNTTGDPVFDDTLRQGLSVQLQQSPSKAPESTPRIDTTGGVTENRRERTHGGLNALNA